MTETMQRIRRYCAYQERCHQEVRQKLWDWGYNGLEIGNIAVQLMEGGFLNEERYANALAGGKFRVKGWGKRKIEQALRRKGVSDYLVAASLSQIEEKDYGKKLLELLEKKKQSLKAEAPLILKHKLARYAISKGYEPEQV
ncbi:MAG: RecX family transcriptional regulator, partial [Bacteroidota bacterium]|nr:RecX family transcriptional regulator [Bacteroidota bacterium]